VQWFLLTYSVPAERSSARVSVWREVRRSGALQLHPSVIAFPDGDPFERAVARIRAAVDEVGGNIVALRAEPLEAADEARLVSAWNEARSDEYAELISECGKLVAEIEKEFRKQKFTLAELDEEEAELDKLKRWRDRVTVRDILGCERAGEAESALGEASEALARYTAAVFDRTHSEGDDAQPDVSAELAKGDAGDGDGEA
jgi:hypothetical protein